MLYLFWILTGVFFFLCIILILVVLIQKGRGGGLSGAFGGGGGGNTAFGAKTGDVLTWATSIIFALFVVLAAVLNLFANHVGGNPQPVQGTQQLPTAPASNSPAAPGK
jgi:preprotein translocase subunit SecG